VGSGTGYIRIGDHVFLGPSCHVAGRGGVEIGAFAGLSARVHIYSVSNMPFHADRPGELATMSHAAPLDQQATVEKPVIIGEYVVIGPGAILLPGAVLGRGAVVHAFSEVSAAFPKFAIVSGHGRGTQKGWRRPGRIDPRLQAGPRPEGPASTNADSAAG
jgi:dTDP-4-amino-4,6-dideoxy-D-glucose acyltransferase